MASTAIIFGASGAIGSDLAHGLSLRDFRTVLVARVMGQVLGVDGWLASIHARGAA